MAVSKELLARYKEMKAKGINITLTELKKQMEEEEKSGANSPETSTVSTDSSPMYSSAPSASEYLSDNSSSYNSYESSPSVVEQTSAPVEQSTPENSWTTTYSSNNYSESVEQPSQTSMNVKLLSLPMELKGLQILWEVKHLIRQLLILKNQFKMFSHL